jgi:hypothetical protein
MAQGNSATVRIYMACIVGDAKLSENGEGLRGESFIQFDDIHLADRQARFRKELPGGRDWAHAHDSRRDSGGRRSEDTRFRRETVVLGS